MANRIQTPSKVTDLFGAGKHGFGDDPNPLLATAFDASWCNGVQEEIVRIIEWGVTNGVGAAPNGAIFDQVLTVLKSFPFSGSPAVANGGTFTMKDASTLTIEGDTGNGGSLLEVAGTEEIQSGGTLRSVIGSIVNLFGNVTIGTTAAQTLTVDAVTQHNENVTIAATKQLTLTGDAKVAGGTSSSVETGKLALQIGAAAPTADGEIVTNSDGYPNFRAESTLFISFGGVEGPWVEENARQIPATALAVTTTVATASKTRVIGSLTIVATGEIQRSAAGSARVSIEQDQGTLTWVVVTTDGQGSKLLDSVDTSNADAWTRFRIEREFSAGVDTLFRLKLEGVGGASAKLRETHLKVRRKGTA